MAICSVEGCDRPAKAKGLCAKDYQQRRYYAAGRPLCLDDQPQITAAPIHSLINFLKKSGATDSQIAKSLGVGARHINQLLTRETICIYSADRIACSWGVHPAEWWSDWGNDCSEEDAA